MKNLFLKFVISALLAMIISSTFTASAAADTSSSGSMPEPEITSETAVLIDASTGGVLYDKNKDKQMMPASITKILTAIVVVKHGKPEDIITVSKNVTDIMKSSYASIALVEGEQITQEQALYAMFLASANDAALALAEHNGGTIDNFVDLMNKEAVKDGATNSRFNNPDGLPDPNNLTTAYDMAMITKAAIKIPEIMKYFSAFTYTIPPTNLQPEKRQLWTLHKMMKNTVFYDKDVIAGKTGWETASGHTLVTVAQQGNIKLICVAMKSSSPYSIYNDTRALLDYGFNNYSDIRQEFTIKPQAVFGVGAQKNSAAVNKPAADINKYNDNKTIIALIIVAFIFCVLLTVFKIRRRKSKNK